MGRRVMIEPPSPLVLGAPASRLADPSAGAGAGAQPARPGGSMEEVALDQVEADAVEADLERDNRVAAGVAAHNLRSSTRSSSPGLALIVDISGLLRLEAAGGAMVEPPPPWQRRSKL